jgi:hypothetical protein
MPSRETPGVQGVGRLITGILVAATLLACSDSAPTTPSTSSTATSASRSNSGATLTLDPAKDYGDRYADGILPVGDNHYTTDAAKQGYVFLCHAGGPGGGGASVRGPWFSTDGTTYDINKKIAVRGTVTWPGAITITRNGDTRAIATNDLPKDHTTGVFPVASDDPAASVDRNPNSINEQSVTYTLTASPTVDAQPHCMTGQVGVMTTGVELFNGFDALLRDAGAWEVQDGCQGHPERTGAYHYHSLSSCITDVGVSTVIGFALDGIPITGPKVSEHNVLTTADLDLCHGITSEITLDGAPVTTYHYVMTQDFPYSASCFRAAPAKAPGEP